MITSRRAVVFAAVLSLSCAVAGCGSSAGSGPDNGSSNAPAASQAKSNPAVKDLPAAIRKAGTITFGSDMTYPPFEFLGPNKTPQGFDIDLATAIAHDLGLKVKFVQNGFDALPTSLASGRFDAVVSAMTDDPTRRKVIDFVDYVEVQGGVMVRVNDSGAPNGFPELCGHTVAVQRGSDQVRQANQKKAACSAAGEKALTVNTYPSAPEQALALKSGRVDAALYDTVTGGYTAKQSGGAFKMGKPYGTPVINGIGVAKTNAGLRDTLKVTLQRLMDDGTYAKLLAKWGMQQAAIPKAVINGGDEGSVSGS